MTERFEDAPIAILHKAEYWCCLGTEVERPRKKSFWDRVLRRDPGFEPLDPTDLWLKLNYTKEEAEAYAYQLTRTRRLWIWDGDPAIPVSLEKVMAKARARGLAGVGIMAYVNGQFQTVIKYPCGQPLPFLE